MKALFFAVAASLVTISAQARAVEIKCKPQAEATTSQFVMMANLTIDEDNSISGTVQYATRSSATAQTSDVLTIQVTGELVVIPAGQVTTHAIESFQIVDSSDSLTRIILNPLENSRSIVIIVI